MSIVIELLKNHCPFCHQGAVFSDKNWFLPTGFPKMNDHCPNCQKPFYDEPGFFFGAMYVNYGLSVLEALLTFGIASLFMDKLFDVRKLLYIGIVVIVLMRFNIKLSRLIWIYLFKDAKH